MTRSIHQDDELKSPLEDKNADEYNDEIIDTTVDFDTTLDTNAYGKDIGNNNDENDIEKNQITEGIVNDIIRSTSDLNKVLTETDGDSNILSKDSNEIVDKDTSDKSDNEDDEEDKEEKLDDDDDDDGYVDNDEDGDVDEDDDDDEDDDNEPPLLKYTRLTKLPPRFFNQDPVSTCLINEKIFIFATHSGLIHLCTPEFKLIRTFKAHMASILSLDYDGEYFASGSMDGTVVVGSIKHEEDIIKFDFKRPIHAVAIDRQYSKTKSFICGGTSGKVIYCSKGWLGQRNEILMDQNNGIITMIKTLDDLVIWSNDNGITIVQITNRAQLLHIDVPKGFKRPELYWPKIHLMDEDRLIIGWVNNLWFFRISLIKDDKESEKIGNIISSAASSFRMEQIDEKKIEIERYVKLDDCMIAGISDINDDLMILNFLPSKKGKFSPPELKILDRITLDELSVDEVQFNNYKGLGLNDYHLNQYLPNHDSDNNNIIINGNNNKKWFLISATDGIVVQEFNLQDKLTWFVSRSNFLKAWELSGLWLDKFEKLKIGIKQVDKYISEDDWDNAVNFLEKILFIDNNFEDDDDKYTAKIVEQWNYWLSIFKDLNKMDFIVDKIPSHSFNNGEYSIASKFYDEILNAYLNQKHFTKLIELINKWDHNLFDIHDIKFKIGEQLEYFDDEGEETEEIKNLRLLYIGLCLELDEPSNCVEHLIKLKDPHLMQFLDEYHLIKEYLNELPIIIMIGIDKDLIKEQFVDKSLKQTLLYTNVQILVENSHEILPSVIIKLMDDSDLDIINYIYLEELGKIDKLFIKNFEDEIIRLYAKYNKSSLYQFITRQKNYSIDKAIKICENYHCTSELVYLLSKIGQNKEALKLIVDDLKDPAMAINFTNSINDKELWDFLLDYSMSKPDFINALLVSAGDWIDPIPVVSRIPKGVEIEGLKTSLVKITTNGKLDSFIYNMILKIIWNDNIAINEKYRKIRSTGYIIEGNDLQMIRNDEDCSFFTFPFNSEHGLFKEEDFIGKDNIWNGHGNKIAHKSYVKMKLGTILEKGTEKST